MAVYRCRFCGSVYDEEKEGTKVSELLVCPVCRVASDKMVLAGGGADEPVPDEESSGGPGQSVHGLGQETAAAGRNGTQPAPADTVSSGHITGEAPGYDPEYARVGTDSL